MFYDKKLAAASGGASPDAAADINIRKLCNEPACFCVIEFQEQPEFYLSKQLCFQLYFAIHKNALPRLPIDKTDKAKEYFQL